MQGVDVLVSVVNFPRHTKAVDTEYQAGLNAVAAIAEDMRHKSQPASSRGNASSASAPPPSDPIATTKAGRTSSDDALLNGSCWRMAEKIRMLHSLAARRNGHDLLGSYAHGFRGQLLHGWPSVAFRPLLGILGFCAAPCCLANETEYYTCDPEYPSSSPRPSDSDD